MSEDLDEAEKSFPRAMSSKIQTSDAHLDWQMWTRAQPRRHSPASRD
jgi:hypothetical protein